MPLTSARSTCIWGDISDVPDERIPEVDVVIGGPPCQGFSNLGSKNVDDPRNKLWKEYLRFVHVARPKVFILENVSRFSKSAEFQLLLDEADGGLLKEYHLEWGVLLAADFGTAQRRPRTIVIGSRVGPIPLPVPTHAKVPTGDLQAWETVRSRIEGLPAQPEATELPGITTTVFEQEVPGPFYSPTLHFRRQPRDMSLARYDQVPQGGGRFDIDAYLLPNCWKNKPTGTTDVMGRMRWDAPSLTIRTEFFKPEKGQYLHPQWVARGSRENVNRVITHYEASLLQDFPADFKWCGTKIQIAKQIGNAVPVSLAAAIARHVRHHLGAVS